MTTMTNETIEILTASGKKLRQCARCGMYGDPVKDFSQESRQPDGTRGYCKSCAQRWAIDNDIRTKLIPKLRQVERYLLGLAERVGDPPPKRAEAE
jgi:hypothetical protein